MRTIPGRRAPELLEWGVPPPVRAETRRIPALVLRLVAPQWRVRPRAVRPLAGLQRVVPPRAGLRSVGRAWAAGLLAPVPRATPLPD